MNDISLHFDGPFTFTDEGDSVFRCCHANSAGIYLWTIQQTTDNTHLIHYVGETFRLAKRHREHLIHILSLDYGIFDIDDARTGEYTLLWKGLWRDRTADGPGTLLREYQRMNESVIAYVRGIRIFFAELGTEDRLRKHIEGCIGWHLRNNRPECKQMYPDDNHVGTMKDKDHGWLLITASGEIQGLDATIRY